jgi:peptidoglycan/LPS O-acetylase OafA/YrhL
MPAHAEMSGPKTTLSRAAATSAPTCSQTSAVPNIKIRAATGEQLPRRRGAQRRGSRHPGISSVNGGPHQTVPLKYRADTDGLRAVAVIAVVLYHAFPSLCPAASSASIFSLSFRDMITEIIVSGLDGPTGFSFADFYARRIRRISPALITVLFATVAAGVWIFLPAELASLAKNAIASAFFNANLMLLSETGYFDVDANQKQPLHLSSLGIEEQFYLAWPLALWLTPHRWRRAMIVIVLTGSFALNVAFVKTHPQATFQLPFTRGRELLAGALLAGVAVKNAKLKEMFGALAFIFAIAFFAYDARTTFPGWAALLPVVGTCLTILAEGCLVSRIFLSHPLAAAIGRISYPLYPGIGRYRFFRAPTCSVPSRPSKPPCWSLRRQCLPGRLMRSLNGRSGQENWAEPKQRSPAWPPSRSAPRLHCACRRSSRRTSAGLLTSLRGRRRNRGYTSAW